VICGRKIKIMKLAPQANENDPVDERHGFLRIIGGFAK
jgi:hypothetical protein